MQLNVSSWPSKVWERRMMRWMAACMIVAALALAACASPNAQSAAGAVSPTLAAEGRRLAQSHCSSCHAIGAEGASPRAEAPPFRTLSVRYPVDSLEEAFGEGVLTGHPAMPEFRFDPDEIDALLVYIQSIQERGAG